MISADLPTWPDLYIFLTDLTFRLDLIRKKCIVDEDLQILSFCLNAKNFNLLF